MGCPAPRRSRPRPCPASVKHGPPGRRGWTGGRPWVLGGGCGMGAAGATCMHAGLRLVVEQVVHRHALDARCRRRRHRRPDLGEVADAILDGDECARAKRAQHVERALVDRLDELVYAKQLLLLAVRHGARQRADLHTGRCAGGAVTPTKAHTSTLLLRPRAARRTASDRSAALPLGEAGTVNWPLPLLGLRVSARSSGGGILLGAVQAVMLPADLPRLVMPRCALSSPEFSKALPARIGQRAISITCSCFSANHSARCSFSAHLIHSL